MIKVCNECGATWLDGQLFYRNGYMGCPHDLAGLLCNEIDSPDCINPCIGSTSCLLYTSPSPRDGLLSRMPSSA